MEGWGWQSVHDPNVLPKVLERWTASIATGQPFDMDFPLRGADGVFRSFLTRVIPVKDSAGQVLRWFGTNTDISALKQVEEALRDSEKRYRRLFEAAKDGILILDANTGKVDDVNPFLLKLLGYSYDDLCGKYIWELGVFKDIAASKEAFKALQDNEYIRYDDLPLETVNGQRIAVEFVSNVYLVDHHKVIQCNIRDITESKKVKKELRDNRAQLDLALLSAGMGMWYWDIVNNKRYFDGQVCHLLGIDAAAFTGTEDEFFGVVHSDDSAAVKEALARAIEQNVLYETTYRAIWPDGSIHYISARGMLARDDMGQPQRISGIIWDVTERKKAEEQLASEKYLQ